ncbi:ABC transporter substrate-binding protein [Paracoccus onubensis]|uniref:ABC transporter substrate-binding protein n=1 Tax=Paracoccus onubensis TaxID=1675788 RepID=UPI002730FA08|nr:ABC transporter substrate-binding protein [Paracoccus onubensis]MDP0930066.1 ABC transporter substrate-binding protein [Paracoccus onubensis]
MKRRNVLKLGTAAAALFLGPGLKSVMAQTPEKSVLRYVPLSDLANIDPVVSTATATRNHAYMVYEGLYALDESFAPQPQMAEGHTVSDDGLVWTFTLRDGLKFHDATPVTARDVVASINRYNAKILPGRTMAERIESLEATDDRTITFTLKEPFPALLILLAKATPSTMPERLASTDASTAITEVVGSGPFRFVAGEYMPGSFAAYEKFTDYVPRSEPASYTAGARNVMVDRVEWRAIPDLATITSALITGEVDWAEAVIPDLVPMMQGDPNLSVERLDEFGDVAQLCLNHLQGPTANPAIRSAIMAALDQDEIMNLAIGDPELYRVPTGNFAPGTPSASDAGLQYLGTPRREPAEIKAMLAEAGYDAEELVMLHATDHPFYGPMAQVIVSRLRSCGFNVRDDIMDRNTMYERRSSKEPIENGGWSMFVTAGNAFLYFSDPISSSVMRAIGEAGYYGWPTNDKLEQLRSDWLSADSDEARLDLASHFQEEILSTAQWIPLGQYLTYSAWRSEIEGIRKAPVPLFWGLSKSS